MAFSERIARLKSSLIREILAAAQRSEVMSFAGGLPAEPMLPKVDWAETVSYTHLTLPTILLV